MRYIACTILILGLFILPACHKNRLLQEDTYEMTFKKNGIGDTLIPYYCKIKSSTTNPGETDFFLQARSPDWRINFSIVIQVMGPINTGDYETLNGSGYYPVTADYIVDQGQPGERDYTIDNAPGQPDGRFFLKITAIEDKVVRGSFSCNYLYDRNYDESILINDGVFTAKRH